MHRELGMSMAAEDRRSSSSAAAMRSRWPAPSFRYSWVPRTRRCRHSILRGSWPAALFARRPGQ